MRFSILAIALFLASPAFGGEEALLRGAGTFTCGRFAQDYAKAPQYVEGLYFAWAQGFLSAQNLHIANDVNAYYDLGGDTELHESFLRNYCNKHPLANYVDAVFELAKTLPRKKYQTK